MINQPTPTPRFMGVGEFAATIGAAESAVYRWIQDQRIAAVKVGGRHFIPRTEIDRLIDEAHAVVAHQ